MQNLKNELENMITCIHNILFLHVMAISCIEIRVCQNREHNTDAEMTLLFSAQEAEFRGVKTSGVFMLTEMLLFLINHALDIVIYLHLTNE